MNNFPPKITSISNTQRIKLEGDIYTKTTTLTHEKRKNEQQANNIYNGAIPTIIITEDKHHSDINYEQRELPRNLPTNMKPNNINQQPEPRGSSDISDFDLDLEADIDDELQQQKSEPQPIP